MKDASKTGIRRVPRPVWYLFRTFFVPPWYPFFLNEIERGVQQGLCKIKPFKIKQY